MDAEAETEAERRGSLRGALVPDLEGSREECLKLVVVGRAMTADERALVGIALFRVGDEAKNLALARMRE
jgi:hypothetical protein